jgi:UTP--glucose-1-phosphate uridylyltransferase
VADAVYQARRFVGDAPFALLFPDNIIFARKPAIRQLMDVRETTGWGGAICGLHRIGRGDAPDFGNCGGVELGTGHQDLWPVLKVRSKGKGHFQIPLSGRGIRMFPRHILTPEFFMRVEKQAGRAGKGEIDDVPIFQDMCAEGKLFGTFVEGRLYDAGNPKGYDAAIRYLHQSGGPHDQP